MQKQLGNLLEWQIAGFLKQGGFCSVLPVRLLFIARSAAQELGLQSGGQFVFPECQGEGQWQQGITRAGSAPAAMACPGKGDSFWRSTLKPEIFLPGQGYREGTDSTCQRASSQSLVPCFDCPKRFVFYPLQRICWPFLSQSQMPPSVKWQWEMLNLPRWI